MRIEIALGLTGPFCKEDIPKWEKFRARKAECDREIARIKEDLTSRKMRKYRDIRLGVVTITGVGSPLAIDSATL